jgi:DNA-binding HxlR family transcriptional regulator
MDTPEAAIGNYSDAEDTLQPVRGRVPDPAGLDRIADKWTVLIVGLLEQRPHRFGELLKGIEGISQKMLTQTLRSLELDGLVNRRAKATVPVTVEYSLTSTGRTLAEPLEAIRRWAEQHIEHVLTARVVGERKQTTTAETGQSRGG